VWAKNSQADARSTAAFGVPAPISNRIEMPRLCLATWTR
jgi:hypothetical protein